MTSYSTHTTESGGKVTYFRCPVPTCQHTTKQLNIHGLVEYGEGDDDATDGDSEPESSP